jgi:hypothetical protein
LKGYEREETPLLPAFATTLRLPVFVLARKSGKRLRLCGEVSYRVDILSYQARRVCAKRGFIDVDFEP